MEIEETKTGPRIVVGDTILVPIVRTSVRCVEAGLGVVGYGFLAPMALAVASGGDRYAIDMTGARMPIERYLEEVPGLAEALAGP